MIITVIEIKRKKKGGEEEVDRITDSLLSNTREAIYIIKTMRSVHLNQTNELIVNIKIYNKLCF